MNQEAKKRERPSLALERGQLIAAALHEVKSLGVYKAASKYGLKAPALHYHLRQEALRGVQFDAKSYTALGSLGKWKAD